MKNVCPSSWSNLVLKLSALVSDLDQDKSSRSLDEIRAYVDDFRKATKQSTSKVNIPQGIGEEVRKEIEALIKVIRGLKDRLIENIDILIEDVNHADINKERFVVLVFGEVNCGKTAFANHLAGLDFDVDESCKGKCFVGDRMVSRLEESSIECTNDYQGFTMPGLLWIDCPGVLSTTTANSNLAHKLVARADFIIILSTSDAPIKSSELSELRKLIEQSGNRKIDACIVIPKTDVFTTDEDPKTRKEIQRLDRKDDLDRKKQEKHCNKQLKESGLKPKLRLTKPIAVSTYIARDRMGRDWEHGSFLSEPANNWELNYQESGFPDFYELLENILNKEGVKIKASWSKKRMCAFKYEINGLLEKGISELERTIKKLKEMRYETNNQIKNIVKDAQDETASEVKEILYNCGMGKNVALFNRERASQKLQKMLKKTVEQAIDKGLRKNDAINKLNDDIVESINNFCHTARFDFSKYREEYSERTYKSTKKSEAIGRGIGGASGAIAGMALGSMIPGLGTIAGGILGGIVGGIAGRFGGSKIGRMASQEKVRIKIKKGTNAEKIVILTATHTKKEAKKMVEHAFKYIDKLHFANLIDELKKVKKQVKAWEKKVSK